MNKDKITVYLSNIKNVNQDELLSSYSESMTDERLERILKVKNENARKSIICTGTLLALVLDKYSVYKDMIVSSSCGKPYIKGREDLFFNISNSGDYVAIAVSDSEVGIDIQKPSDADETLLKRVLSPEDMIEYCNDGSVGFNLLWAGKEAYVKLTGEGIARDLRTVSFKESYIYDNGRKAAFEVCKVFPDGYAMAVASVNNFELEIVRIDLDKR